MVDEPFPDAETLAALGRRVDFRECGPCGGACCRTPWTVFVTPRDVARLEAATGRPREDFATVAPLPAWEREAFGEGNLLFSRVADDAGRVPQLRKRPDGACVLLDERGLCGVHASKPLLCRLFPFYYDRIPGQPGEVPSPLRSDGGGLRLLVDRGHAGRCPIPLARMEEVERAAADALLALVGAFERDVADYERVKGDFTATWPRPG